ncbi:hypothetical protein RRG08_024669 [Elysia crispata]|uniref:Uncharacterized protein n=1 Tax=Elysia crispata TaxID=231223 RepID=A0AAE0ZX22_9GAST|nr:hypothetical protein RRG08_024669 [Elysia crispata]
MLALTAEYDCRNRNEEESSVGASRPYGSTLQLDKQRERVFGALVNRKIRRFGTAHSSTEKDRHRSHSHIDPLDTPSSCSPVDDGDIQGRPE